MTCRLIRLRAAVVRGELDPGTDTMLLMEQLDPQAGDEDLPPAAGGRDRGPVVAARPRDCKQQQAGRLGGRCVWHLYSRTAGRGCRSTCCARPSRFAAGHTRRPTSGTRQ